MAVQRNISVFLFGANVFVFTEIGVNIKIINGQTIITQWKTCKGVLLNGINIYLNEMKVSLGFFCGEWDILYITIKFYFKKI